MERTGHFGELLKESRLQAGLTQEALAEQAGLSVEAIRALERGRRGTPRPDTVTRLASVLGKTDLPRLASATRTVPADTPPSASRHNLPATLDSFVGREREQAQVAALFERERLVTLVGAGGIGKTRLALAVAERLIDTYPHGVWLVELASLANPVLVPEAVATALALRPEANRPMLATLVEYLRSRHLLLLLDNCEHLVTACAALVTALLRACPDLHLLVTSREPLRLMGERRYRVQALRVPPGQQPLAVELIERYEAVQLFVARACERVPDFALHRENAGAVAEICARLDGIPLAIELAAAWIGLLPVTTIAARLDDRFRLLVKGPRAALPRQQTLRAALDWSWDLLEPRERHLLARLAVFAGGGTQAAVLMVCADPALDEWAMLDMLGALADKSWLSMDEQAYAAGETRYRLLETIREYALEQLQSSGEAEALRRAHAAYYLELTEAAERTTLGPARTAALARLERERDNLRAALAWSIEDQQGGEMALRLAGALGTFWHHHGHLSEGRHWLARVLASPTAVETGPARAKALYAAGLLAGDQGDHRADLTLQEHSVALWRSVGDRMGLGQALTALGVAAVHQSDLPRARATLEESVAHWRTINDPCGLGEALYELGQVYRYQGDYTAAQARWNEAVALFRTAEHTLGLVLALSNLGDLLHGQGESDAASTRYAEGLAVARSLEDPWEREQGLRYLALAAYRRGDYEKATRVLFENLALIRELGDPQQAAWTLNHLGDVARRQDDYERAAQFYRQSLALFDEQGHRQGRAAVLHNQGHLALAQGDPARAARLFAESLRLFQDLGYQWNVADCLAGMAGVAVAEGQLERAARLFGAEEAAHEACDASGVLIGPANKAAWDRDIARGQAQMGAAAWAEAWATGRALSLEQAVYQALEGWSHLSRS